MTLKCNRPGDALVRLAFRESGFCRGLFSLFLVAAGLWVGPRHLLRAQPAASTNQPLPTLTQAMQILQLTRQEAEQHYPVQWQGVVTCFDQRAQLFFIQDGTSGIYIYNVDLTLRLKSGDLIEVTGITAAGLFSPIIHSRQVKVLGEANLPRARRVSIEELVSGQLDSQWVEVRGTIHRAVEDWGHLVLDLVNGTSRLKVRVLDFPKGAENQLIDARVRIRGVLGTHFNNKGQLTGFHLLVPNMAQVAVQESPMADPYASPVRPIRSLMAYSQKEAADRRVRLQGTVTLQRLGKLLYLKDSTGGIRARTEQKTPVKVGDVVDAVGFPSALGYTPVLEDALYKVIGHGAQPTPVSVTVTQALSGDLDSELVQLRANLLEFDDSLLDEQVLVLEADKNVFRAHLAKSPSASKSLLLRKGSVLQVTGICSVTMDENFKPRAFDLHLRSPEDIEILQRPARWKMSVLAWVLGFASAIVLIGVIWMSMMNRRVQQQTEAIRRRETALEERYRDLFENAHDIIYSHDADGNLKSLNKAGEQILGYSQEEALRMNIADVIAPEYENLVREQLNRKLRGVPRTNYEVEVIAKDGRRLALEVNTRLQIQDGNISGIQGIARDITARKVAEAALRESERQLRVSLEERERIGRDLHDGIIQSIYAVGLNLEDCRRLVKEEPLEVENRLRKVLNDLNNVIRDVRNFIVGLESDLLKGQEFKAALKSLILTLGETHSFRFILQIDSLTSERLNPKQATNLLHIAREAISNSVRHAQAQRTVLSLQRRNDHIRFEVRDDGIGFNSAATEHQGYGLRNMAARAQELGASFTVTSKSGEGTRIVLEIPAQNEHQTILK